MRRLDVIGQAKPNAVSACSSLRFERSVAFDDRLLLKQVDPIEVMQLAARAAVTPEFDPIVSPEARQQLRTIANELPAKLRPADQYKLTCSQLSVLEDLRSVLARAETQADFEQLLLQDGYGVPALAVLVLVIAVIVIAVVAVASASVPAADPVSVAVLTAGMAGAGAAAIATRERGIRREVSGTAG